MSTVLESTSWHNYPSIYAIGHRYLTELLLDPVQVEEKIDGSQFSFGRFNGELRCRSKGAVLNVLAPEKMFQKAVDVAGSLDLQDGWTYRAEYLAKPKHNTLAYDRVPKNHLIVFDVNTGHESYLCYQDRWEEADRLGLEAVAVIFAGIIDSPDIFRWCLESISVLGGQKVEGVVVKNYSRYGPDKKALMGKFVSEAFKEIHGKEWKSTNPQAGDVVEQLITRYKTAARWAKAVQHLKEAGQIDGSPKDIGVLIPEVRADIERECADEIKELLYKWAIPKITRACVSGLPEWYKEELLKSQFE